MFTAQVNSPLRGPGFSRAAANAQPSAHQPSNRSAAPIQFSLFDAQLQWKRWYKTADVTEEKIIKYIAAKKRGWWALKVALEKPDAEMADDGPVDEEELPLEQGQDKDEEELFIHDDDEDMVKDIQDKQSQPVSDKGIKHETDLRKHASAKYFAGGVSGDQLTPFSTFFVKNSPPGYNRSVETEADTYEYQFDPHYDRDFTFPLTEELSTEKRGKTDYFRTTASHKHVRREKMDNQLRKIIVGQYPAKKSQINSRQVYMSFDVQKVGNDHLMVVSPQGGYKNIKMLGAGTDSQIVKKKIDVGGHSLTIWINTKSANHQSRYNASAIVPNFIQYEEILRSLQTQPIIEIEPEGEPQEKEFHQDTIDFALEAERGAPVNDYKKRMLADRKQLISLVSATINEAVKKDYIKAIAVDKDFSFYQYPCLILQPMKNYVRDFEVKKKGAVDQLKRNIVFTLHEEFNFSFANRQSFGFANPTVGDVATSVRIWPGLINPGLFSEMMFKTLHKAGLLKNQPGTIEYEDKERKSPLSEALGIAILRASERYTRYKKIKEEGRELHQLQSMYDWILNRITSNVFKAEKLIDLLKTDPSDLEVNKRAVRTLENLNEYDFLQAGVEEQTHQQEDRGERAGELLEAFRRPVMDKKFGGWKIIAVKLRSSGMDAYRAALEIIGDARQDSSRLYFETAKVNKEIAAHPQGLHKLGSITKMMDPSYNFVSHEDITTQKSYEWAKEKDYPTAHVYDITNTTLEDAFGKIGDVKPDFVLFFESLSKHFQFGMDKSTIGRLIVYMNETTRDEGRASTLKMRAGETKDTPMPHYALNYLGLQSRYYGV